MHFMGVCDFKGRCAQMRSIHAHLTAAAVATDARHSRDTFTDPDTFSRLLRGNSSSGRGNSSDNSSSSNRGYGPEYKGHFFM